MRAVVFDTYGGPEVLRAVELPRPAPGPGQALVRVAAASVNPADWRVRDGQFRLFLRLRLPFVPGSDIAGTVVAVGDGVDPAWFGRDVFAALPTRRGGGYAEYAVVDVGQLAEAPGGSTMAEASALPLCGLTAMQALRAASLREGDALLVHGASGGVGTLAVQVGRLMGATVTAVTSTRNLDLVKGLGAHQVLDYTKDDLSARAGAYDVVFDAVNAVPVRSALRLLRRDGTLVSVNPGAALRHPSWLAWTRRGRRVRSVVVRPDGADLAKLADWATAGLVRPVVEQTFALERVREAHRRSATGRVRGKLVLEMSANDSRRTVAPA